MALRFLAVKLTKALPLRVPGFRASKVQEDLSRKIAAALDPTKYKSGKEMFDTVQPLVVEETRSTVRLLC
ncbi:hypothetical protein U9M48_011705 [Paspalum notatum var. saurae]|uniref:Uncharacterized protein n=1 Tax=Paspalum notatum var. saurae TaxID=547442 RepID=A0AAQ3SWD1_PASNO